MINKSLVIIILLASVAYSSHGKLYLINGYCLEGDISKADNGGYWIAMRSGSVKFEKNEIRRIVIFSTQDTVKRKFLDAFQNTSSALHANKITPYENLINHEAKQNNLDPALIKAVIKAESNFNSVDKSSKGACGLMQLMPETARLLGVKSIYSPHENIEAGTRFLKNMLYEFNGDLDLALAAYNAGPGTVHRYNNTVPPYKETKKYLKTVNKYYNNFKKDGKIYTCIDESGCLNIYNIK